MPTDTKERPILFSAEMVRAILDGRKTVTRRPVRFPRNRDALVLVEQRDGSLWPYQSDDGESEICDDGCEHPIACPYGLPGDRLWVRETWWVDRDRFGEGGIIPTAYRADGEMPRHMSGERWRPSIYMPRMISRITLEVTGVRVERVQAITSEGANAEGFRRDETHGAKMRFSESWNALYGAKHELMWSSNPWVWVVEFKRLEGSDA